MAQKKDRSVSSEVESRLEELFTEHDGPDSDNIFEESDPADDGLRALKSAILYIDWEINDETMSSLMDQIKLLTKIYQQDRILTLFLQLLGKLCIYIKTQKVNAHPNSIKLLNSVYKSFEKAVMDHKLNESDRKKLLQKEVNHFLKLKEQISKKNIQRVETPVKEYSKAIENKKTDMPIEFVDALEEIKTMIRAEFRDLKAEIKMLIQKRS